MNVDVKQIESVVRKAITRTLKENTFSSLGLGIFSDMDDAIEAAAKAQGSLISMNFSYFFYKASSFFCPGYGIKCI